MHRFRRDVIHTYGDGIPIEGRPDPLPADHLSFPERRARGLSPEEARPFVDAEIEHERAWSAYEYRVADVQLASFTLYFKHVLKEQA